MDFASGANEFEAVENVSRGWRLAVGFSLGCIEGRLERIWLSFVACVGMIFSTGH